MAAVADGIAAMRSGGWEGVDYEFNGRQIGVGAARHDVVVSEQSVPGFRRIADRKTIERRQEADGARGRGTGGQWRIGSVVERLPNCRLQLTREECVVNPWRRRVRVQEPDRPAGLSRIARGDQQAGGSGWQGRDGLDGAQDIERIGVGGWRVATGERAAPSPIRDRW